jgi:hypothetical protein
MDHRKVLLGSVFAFSAAAAVPFAARPAQPIVADPMAIGI